MIPSSYQALGEICLIKTRDKKAAKELLKKHKRFKSVYFQKGISGKLRKPNVEWLAGEKETTTKVRENYCDFIVDISKVMFSKGNQEEKRRIVRQVKKEEEVLDMFAGIGYFTIPIAKLSEAKEVWAVELNPDSIELLRQNLKLNGIQNKVNIVQGDCREEVPKLNKKFDRVLLGYLNSKTGTYKFLLTAIRACKKGGVIHFHEIARTAEEVEKKVNQIAGDKVKLLRKKKVKEYAPKVWHWVLDLQLS